MRINLDSDAMTKTLGSESWPWHQNLGLDPQPRSGPGKIAIQEILTLRLKDTDLITVIIRSSSLAVLTILNKVTPTYFK